MIAQHTSRKYPYIKIANSPQKICLAILGNCIDEEKLAAIRQNENFEILLVADKTLDVVSAADAIVVMASCKKAIEIASQIQEIPIIWITDLLNHAELGLVQYKGIRGIVRNLDNLKIAVETVRSSPESCFLDKSALDPTKSNLFFLSPSDREINQWATLLAWHTVNRWIERQTIAVPTEKILQDLGLSQDRLIDELEVVDREKKLSTYLKHLMRSLQIEEKNFSSTYEFLNISKKYAENLLEQRCQTILKFNSKSLIHKSQAQLQEYLKLWLQNGTEARLRDLFKLKKILKQIKNFYQEKQVVFFNKENEIYAKYSDELENERIAKQINKEARLELWNKLSLLFDLRLKQQIYKYGCTIVSSLLENLEDYEISLKTTDSWLREAKIALELILNQNRKISPFPKAYLDEQFSIQEVEQELKTYFEKTYLQKENKLDLYKVNLERFLVQYFEEEVRQLYKSFHQEFLLFSENSLLKE